MGGKEASTDVQALLPIRQNIIQENNFYPLHQCSERNCIRKKEGTPTFRDSMDGTGEYYEK